MALVDNAWYVDYGDGSTTGYYGVAKWTTVTTYAVGAIIRQKTAPAVNSERCFVCIVAGTALVSEPASWTTTRGGKTAEAAGPTWQECTGIAALNGDATNTPSWTITATPPGGVKGTSVTLGQVIKRDNGVSYQICTTSGTAGSGSEPAFSDTAGTTTADNTVTWTSLGVVGNFTGWQAPHARLANAVATNWGRAGNAFFVASEHAETQGTSITLLGPGSITLPCYVYCVTKTTVPPVSANLTTGAGISTTSSSDIFITGVFYFQGITMTVGDGGNNNSLYLADQNVVWNKFKNCALVIRNTGNSGLFSVGRRTADGDNLVELDNTTLQFAAVAQSMRFRSAKFAWKNTPTAIAGATFPTILFKVASNGGQSILEGVDLSALGSGKTLVDAQTQTIQIGLKDCKLNAAVTIAVTPTGPSGDVTLINCDSGATNYRTEKYSYQGTQTTETTIVRTGGASSGTVIAWKIVTTSDAKWVMPYEALPLVIWNTNITTDVTITLYGIWGGGAVPNKDDIWFDAEFLGASSTPQAIITTAGKADNLAASVGWGTDTSTWGGSTTKFKMTLTLPSAGAHPLQVGPIYLYIKAAKASSTSYIDPLPVLS